MTRPLSPRKRQSERGTSVTFWLPASMVVKLEREARRERVTRSKLILSLLRRVVEPERAAKSAAA